MASMIEIELKKLQNIWNFLPPKPDFIIVGEMHGSQQNAPLIEKFARALLTQALHITIAFEWTISDTEFDVIRNYIHEGTVPEKLPRFFLDSDGRVTHEHFDLLKWIRSYNMEHDGSIDICAFDTSLDNGDSEQMLANALLSSKARNPGALFLVETGNMHARNVAYTSNNEEHVPMAAILKETNSVFSVFVKYLAGKVLVEGTPRDVTKATSQQESPEPYFDGIVKIPESRPAAEITDSTDVVRKFRVQKEGR